MPQVKRKAKDEHDKIVINPTFDFIFTAIFGMEFIFCFYCFYVRTVQNQAKAVNMFDNDLAVFTLVSKAHINTHSPTHTHTHNQCLLIVSAAIYIIRKVSTAFFVLISRTILKNEPFGDPLSIPKTREKFTSQFWQASIHFTLGMLEIRELAKNNFEWLYDAETTFYPYPWKQEDPTSVRTLYLIQLAIWIVTCFSHKYIEEKHKDYFLMYAHHVVTIALIIGSYVGGFTRIGIVVLFIHDVSDIPIDCLKLSNYLKLENAPGFFIVEMSYATVMTSWLYMRLYLFPYYVIYNGVMHAGSCQSSAKTVNGDLTLCNHYKTDLCQRASWGEDYNELYGMYPFLNGKCDSYATTCLLLVFPLLSLLLISLFFMHILWYKLLGGIGLKLLTMSPHEAGRQDYEGADEEIIEDNGSNNSKKDK
jgi:hypothetical protein